MPSQSQPASPRRVLAVLSLAAFMAALDLFIVNVAFEDIGRDFGDASLGSLSWVLNGYAIVYAALLVPLGRLADRRPREGGAHLGRHGRARGGLRPRGRGPAGRGVLALGLPRQRARRRRGV